MRRETTSGVQPTSPLEGFALDHLTVIETTPRRLAETAAAAGYGRICTFVRSIEGLGGPTFDLSADLSEMKATRAELAADGVTVDVAYPFTLSDRTRPGDFEADLDCAAALEARFVNLLCFVRDPGRIRDETARFCERARARRLKVAIEMVPASTIRTLAQATILAKAVGPAADVGVNLDVLHLYRSGGTPSDILPYRDRVSYLQICDGPLELPVESRRAEASLQRRLPGNGAFDLAEVLRSLPEVPASLEIPDEAARTAGVGPVARAIAARDAARAIAD